MEIATAFMALGVSLGLGLLVGVQRQRADSALAGFRTFPLITILGTLCAMLADRFGAWPIGAGLLCVAIATCVGNFMRPRSDSSPGITTEIAALVMFAVGALVWTGPRETAIGIGVVTAVLLAAKAPMHRLAARMGDQDLRAILQFALVTFVVLPVLPDRSMGPLGALNPHQVWMMVVLVVGISLAGYIGYKLVPRPGAVLVSGLLGGLVSSTATTASQSRRCRGKDEAVPAALVTIVLSASVVFVRVLVEMSVVARERFFEMSAPMMVMLGGGVAVSTAVYLRCRSRIDEGPAPENPSEMKSALYFAGLYAVVLLAVAAARRYAGESGLYAVAALSGLTDMDAITLSTSRLVEQGGLDAAVGSRAVVIASMSNLVFKAAMVLMLGSARLFRPVAVAFGVLVTLGLALVLLG